MYPFITLTEGELLQLDRTRRTALQYGPPIRSKASGR